jgi:hypothetical protein
VHLPGGANRNLLSPGRYIAEESRSEPYQKGRT